MSKNRKGFWIPGEVFLNEQLDLTNKILFSEILALSKLENGCTASNSHFANLIETKPAAVSKRLKQLEEMGYISRYNHYSGNQCIGRSIHIKKIMGSSSGNVGTNLEGTGYSEENNMVVTETTEGISVDNNRVFTIVDGGCSSENRINTTINSDILIQETIQYTGEENKNMESSSSNDNSTMVEEKNEVKTTLTNSERDELRQELIDATKLGKDIFLLYRLGNIERIKEQIGEEDYSQLEPRLKSYLDAVFK